MEIYNVTPDEAINILNSQSGYLAIANDKDAKNIVERSKIGDSDSILLRKMADHDFKKNLLSMMSNLNTIDSIITAIQTFSNWALRVGIALAGVSLIIGFILYAVADVDQKQRVKQS